MRKNDIRNSVTRVWALPMLVT